MLKRCISCKVEKALSEFYAHPQMKDGHAGRCKECSRRGIAESRRNRIEDVREYDRKRGSLPHRLAAIKAYQKSEVGKAAAKRAKERWEIRHREKRRAQWALSNAVRDGRLVRAKYCERCSDTKRIEGHHPDYSKPLEVQWLCDPCHKAVHKEERAANRLPPKKPVGSVVNITQTQQEMA